MQDRTGLSTTLALRLEGVSVVRDGTEILADVDWCVDARRAVGRHRPERLGQDDAAADRRRAAAPVARHRSRSSATGSARRTGARCGRGSGS